MKHVVACHGDRGFTFSPETSALIIIDMQKDFLAADGMAGVGGEAVERLTPIVPRLERLLAIARQAGLPVIHTREGFAPDLSDVPALRRERGSVGRDGPLGRFLIRGEAGQDIIEALRPLDHEVVIDKPGFSAFYRTSLESHLKESGITHLVITGVTTQCCVLSTLRAAVDRGFYCLLLEDCCAAFDDRLHQATLEVIQGENHLFGWISDSRRLIDTLEAAAP